MKNKNKNPLSYLYQCNTFDIDLSIRTKNKVDHVDYQKVNQMFFTLKKKKISRILLKIVLYQLSVLIINDDSLVNNTCIVYSEYVIEYLIRKIYSEYSWNIFFSKLYKFWNGCTR